MPWRRFLFIGIFLRKNEINEGLQAFTPKSSTIIWTCKRRKNLRFSPWFYDHRVPPRDLGNKVGTDSPSRPAALACEQGRGEKIFDKTDKTVILYPFERA